VDELTRAGLESILARKGFPPNSYRLCGDPGAGERYVLDHGSAGWEAYYSERGLKSGLRTFRSEGEACKYFLDLLRSDLGTQHRD
jgi:hypothetical protein